MFNSVVLNPASFNSFTLKLPTNSNGLKPASFNSVALNSPNLLSLMHK